jgi:hypothetical protein
VRFCRGARCTGSGGAGTAIEPRAIALTAETRTVDAFRWCDNESDAPEPSVTSGPGPDDEFANQQQRRGSLGPSLEPLSSSPKTVPATQT